MRSWYYADGHRHRHGPVAEDTLLGLYRDRVIALDTLLWREGPDNWLPLSACADTLGPPVSTDVRAAAFPPPLPPAAAQPPLTYWSVAPAQPRSNRPGWPLVAVIGAVIGVFVLVGVIGMLAAIAFPAYHDYLGRAKLAEVMAELTPLKPQIAEFRASEGRSPVNGDPGFKPPGQYASERLSSVRIGRFDSSECDIEAVIHAPRSAKIDSKALWLQLDADAGSWHCSSEIDDTQLLPNCRG
ncbi:pilus assembly protein PilA [Xanthomonas oryzae pv. oryzae]|uniref:pilin n=1 Tax=Xanthomonas oryzae TaxID=347 RepID=UPI000C7DE743|nr:pilin [Xanthomonas oryzae]AUI89365.1 pilus assembly protein PilA [Xanthomonas oryzae pv. oryzae]AUI93042.1 pilus assembly protein PilA [Xanthomonas oryzae pv. oryzae]AUI96713.1 pilus assembly protein PilA [Xanthomonas oryzae pv. oryzae]AUJ00384.1 pilus assembly protein PilA [Xanthomonas oryzae pv. oryzae]AUJ04062.1 pilus assembly protein PilA [Xanthomonas oryzae pv. oryzae]